MLCVGSCSFIWFPFAKDGDGVFTSSPLSSILIDENVSPIVWLGPSLDRFFCTAKGAMMDIDNENAPLMLAAKAADVDGVDRLLKAGEDIDAASRRGETALWWAACLGHESVVAKLLAAGANISLCNSMSWTPLIAAAANGHVAIARRLLDVEPNPRVSCSPVFFVAVMRNQPAVVELLLEYQADDSIRDSAGATPLIMAAFLDHPQIVRQLASAPHASASRDLALINAAGQGSVESTELLLVAGANVNFESPAGNTALGLARKRRHRGVIKVLVAHGASLAKTQGVKRRVPAIPVVAPTLLDAEQQSLADEMKSTNSSKRRAAAKKVRGREASAFEPTLVAALAKELEDIRSWETQVEMARALGGCGVEVESARWLEKALLEISFESTVVAEAMAWATMTISIRSGAADPNAMLETWLNRIVEAEQKLAVLQGLLKSANELRVVFDPKAGARLSAFLAQPGELSRAGEHWLRSVRQAWDAQRLPHEDFKAAFFEEKRGRFLPVCTWEMCDAPFPESIGRNRCA
jgi:hypothetical protein